MKRLSLIVILIGLHAFAAQKVQLSTFEQGRRQYEGGKYGRALELFGQTIKKAPDATTRNKAYYFQGLVLFELGYYYSSFEAFKNVLGTTDETYKELYEKAIKNAVILSDKLDRVAELGKLLKRFPPNLIPGSVVGLSHYATGVYEFEVGDTDGAMSHLKSVAPENQFYSKALIYLGALATKKKDYKEAIYYFEKAVTLNAGKRETYSQAELARLNLARSLYSAGDIERSVETYAQFLSSSPHWLTVLLEASWPLMRANDTTVSLGNLHTVTSPYYREDLVGEAYILRATILFSLCKYEEMRRTLAAFMSIYDPVFRSMQAEQNAFGAPEAFFRAFHDKKGLNRSFINYGMRDEGIQKSIRVFNLLMAEKQNLGRLGRNDQMADWVRQIENAQKVLSNEIGVVLQRLHKRKLNELMEQREQANYLKVEIVTGEKEMIEGQKGLPPKRIVDVETSVSEGYRFWPYIGEYWEDELGTYIYTTESACVN